MAARQGRHWAFVLSSDWRSGYPHTVPVARYAIGDPLDEEPTRYLYRPDINNGRLPPYLRFDATMGYRFQVFGAWFSTKLYVYNISNRRNVIDYVYDPSPPEGVAVEERRGLFLIPNLEFQIEF